MKDGMAGGGGGGYLRRERNVKRAQRKSSPLSHLKSKKNERYVLEMVEGKGERRCRITNGEMERENVA